MKQRIVLLVGLTAVSLLILLTSCTQPATPEPTTPPTIAATAQPTSAPTPIPTLEPTPTPTYSQQANQLLLANGRFTTLLDELTQEIGRDLSEAEQEQVLALARALWLPPPAAGLPDQLDENDWLPDPADVTLHWRPALDGREGPILLVREAQPDSLYAAGTVVFWQEERLLNLTPSEPGYYLEFGRVQQNGRDFETWIEYDAEGNWHSFIHPETGQWQKVLQNLVVLNGRLMEWDEASNQWNQYQLSAEVRRAIEAEGWELSSVSVSEARNIQFLVVEDMEGNPVLTWDAFKKDFVRSYYSDYYGRGPLRIYPAIEYEVIDPELLEQRIDELGQVAYRPYTSGSNFNDFTYFMAFDNLLITGINHHAVSQVGANFTEIEVVFKTPAGELVKGTVVYKNPTVLRLPSGETQSVTPPHLGIEPGDIISVVSEYFPPEYTPDNPDPSKNMGYDRYQGLSSSFTIVVASFLFGEARISTDQLLTALGDHRWEQIGGIDDKLLLNGRIEIIDRP